MPDRGSRDDLITLDAVIKKYGHNQQWWHQRLSDPKIPIRRWVNPLDEKRTYLSISEIEEWIQPHPKRQPISPSHDIRED